MEDFSSKEEKFEQWRYNELKMSPSSLGGDQTIIRLTLEGIFDRIPIAMKKRSNPVLAKQGR
ncbi:MAG: hypothetical protein K6C05_03395 [Anaerovibrio sp.]|uniref:hypothetical protein n=1 Tax=Anaerovibrio sp. TaxID=1872532 RepID=UPI0025D160BA|nr:hypothetical protein [Anaerovibrio sp.]MCR5175877.1 hypothetical protein [Anaerovibrio sp.]